MISLAKPFSPIIIACVLSANFTNSLAQATPDAGSIARDFERNSRLPESPRPSVPPIISGAEPVTPSDKAGPRFHVSGFKISGVTAFPNDELQKLLSDLTTKDVSLGELQQALDRLSGHYRQHGYFVARAYLPAQDIQDGIVAITILEGTVSEIVVKPTGKLRLSTTLIERTMRKALPADAVVRAEPIERGLLLMYDLPGIEARSTLSPGNEVGTSTLTIDVSEGPLISGSADADNFGSRYSGKNHIGGMVSLNNPSGIGDQLTLRAAQALDTSNARLRYQIPVGVSGLKLGVEYAATQYALCCEFAALDANGHARELVGNALYPIVRSRNYNLFGTLSYGRQRFFNSANNVTTSNSRLESTTLALRGNNQDSFGEGGMTDFNLSVTDGQLNLDGVAADLAQDAVTARTHGHYQKTNYVLARQQRLSNSVSVKGGVSGQFASKNLNSAEKFVLGGINGVRAYPTGEASGDEGWLATGEIAYQLNTSLEFSGFIDHGEVVVHKNLWPGANAGAPFIKNRYALSGAGVGLKWSRPSNYLLRAILAFPVGDNPGRDAKGHDADGKQAGSRLWLQAIKQF